MSEPDLKRAALMQAQVQRLQAEAERIADVARRIRGGEAVPEQPGELWFPSASPGLHLPASSEVAVNVLEAIAPEYGEAFRHFLVEYVCGLEWKHDLPPISDDEAG